MHADMDFFVFYTYIITQVEFNILLIIFIRLENTKSHKHQYI